MENDIDEYSLRQQLIIEMLSSYRPTPAGQQAAEEKTSMEIVTLFSSTIDVSITEISLMMKKLGFRICLHGSDFFWQIDKV